MVANLRFGTRWTSRRDEPTADSIEVDTLANELPTTTVRKIAMQVVLLVPATVLLIVLATSRDDPPSIPTPNPEQVVPVDGPTIEYRGRRYQLGRIGDLAIVRKCDGIELPWLLRPSTGVLYRFDTWAGSEVVDAIQVRTVDGAVGLRVVKGALCDQIQVDVTGGSQVIISG